MPAQRRHHHPPTHALIPTSPFHPTPNPAAFRDLLIFEERLKQAAARYTRRKRKYQTLLTFLLAATLTSAYHAAASSPHWSGILDLALRWAADPDTDYRTGLNGAEYVPVQGTAHSHHRVRKGISRVRGRDTADRGAAANNNAAERRQRRSTGGAGAGAVASAAGKAKGAVWDVVDAGADSAAAVVSAAVSAALASGSGGSTLSSKTNNNNNKGKARAAFAFRTDSPLISTPPSASTDKASPLAASKTPSSPSPDEERTYYTHADGAAMLRYYLWVGLFLFFSTTTFLFFASGLYSERIAAGATFVPQANRALGYYNLYLNTRTGRGAGGGNREGSREEGQGEKRGRGRSGLGRAASWFWGSQSSPTPPSPSPSEKGKKKPKPASSTSNSNSNSDDDDDSLVTRAPPTPTHHPTSSPNQPPPSTNPRGELLLGPRVHTEFRHGYERYRAEFERRRAMRIEAQRRGRGWGGRVWRVLRGWVWVG